MKFDNSFSECVARKFAQHIEQHISLWNKSTRMLVLPSDAERRTFYMSALNGWLFYEPTSQVKSNKFPAPGPAWARSTFWRDGARSLIASRAQERTRNEFSAACLRASDITDLDLWLGALLKTKIARLGLTASAKNHSNCQSLLFKRDNIHQACSYLHSMQ